MTRPACFLLLLLVSCAPRFSYREARQVQRHNQQAVRFYQRQHQREARRGQRARRAERKEPRNVDK